MKNGSFQRIRFSGKRSVYARHMNQAHVLEAVASLYIALNNKPTVITHIAITKMASQCIPALHHFLSYSIFHLLQMNIPSE